MYRFLSRPQPWVLCLFWVTCLAQTPIHYDNYVTESEPATYLEVADRAEIWRALIIQDTKSARLPLTQSCQEVSFPEGNFNSPSPYSNNQDLCFKVSLSEELVFLFWNYLDLEASSGCTYDYVEIYHNYNQTSQTADLIGRYCGSNTPPGVWANAPLYFVFHTDDSVVSTGFSMSWITASGEPAEPTPDSSCAMYTSSGTLSTINYPDYYDDNEDWCAVLTGEYFYLAFNSRFNIEQSESCIYDYMSITENGITTRYCGRQAPRSGIYAGPLVIRFHSDETYHAQGFHLMFHPYSDVEPETTTPLRPTLPTPDGCTARNNRTGFVNTTNYPSNYPNRDSWCVYIRGEYIQLTLLGSFSMESCGDSCSCDYLSLTLNDMTTRYCGAAPSQEVFQGPLTLRFSSDGSVTRSGFSFQYNVLNEYEQPTTASYPQSSEFLYPSTTSPEPETTTPPRPTLPTPDGCTARNNRTGFVNTTNYPSNYPNRDSWCVYIRGEYIHLTLLGSFIMEICGDDCVCDYLSVTVNDMTTRYCGAAPSQEVFQGPLTLRFISDGSVTRSGFSFRYSVLNEYDGTATFSPYPSYEPNTTPSYERSTPSHYEHSIPSGSTLPTPYGCTTRNTRSGSVYTTNYPSNYPNGDSWCVYLRGEYIQLTLLGSFSLEGGSDCPFDYLSLTTNGITTKYCEEPPYEDIFQGPLTMRFRSDGSVTHTGFSFQYDILDDRPPTTTTTRAPCQVRTTDGNLTTTNYPGLYNSNEDWCVIIQGNIVELVISDGYDVYYSLDCSQDYWILMNNGEENRYCGSTLPFLERTFNGSVQIDFHSNYRYQRIGFEIVYRIDPPPPTPPTCEVRDVDGFVSTSNYPGYYNNYEDWCVIIQGITIELEFAEYYNIEFSYDCSLDYLTITNNGRQDQYCGGSEPFSQKTFVGDVELRFHSNSRTPTTGFYINYYIDRPPPTPAPCEVRIHDGVLSSHYNDHYEYSNNEDWCVILQGDLINTDMSVFTLAWSSNCTDDYLSITYNGETNRYCGSLILPEAVFVDRVEFRFHSNFRGTTAGFRATYSITNCAVQAVNGTNIIQSSNYPAAYSNNENWCERIDGQNLKLSFVGSFEVPSQTYNYTCTQDYVKVSTVDGIIGTYCANLSLDFGGMYNGPVFVQFHSDNMNTGQGFSLSFTESEPHTSPYGSECRLVSGLGSISTNNTGTGYEHNKDWCIFFNEFVDLKYSDDFSLESSSDCSFDFVSLEVMEEYGSFISRYCGTTAPSDGPRDPGRYILAIRFHSDDTITDHGFTLMYNTYTNSTSTTPSLDSCDWGNDTGTIQTTNYPEMYGNSEDWCITLHGDRIQLTSEAFDLEYSPNCTDDYLAITVRGVTHKFCGNSQPPLGIYTGNITLHFHSDWAKERTGFSIRYERLNSTEFQCGQPMIPLPSIYGGETSVKGQWPWQAHLKKDGAFNCGAVIISSQLVLTAAHCITSYFGSSGYAEPSSIIITVGEYNTNYLEGTEVEHTVESLVPHPGADLSDAASYANDIALLRLTMPIEFNEYVQPVCLTTVPVGADVTCWATGWGDAYPGSSVILQQVGLLTMSTTECAQLHQGTTIGVIREEQHVCTQLPQKGVCSGDSGGPLVCSSGGSYFLHGLASFTVRPCATHPSVFSRVTSYIDWIQYNIPIGGYDEPSIFDPQESEPSTVVPHMQNGTRAMTTAMDEPHYQPQDSESSTLVPHMQNGTRAMTTAMDEPHYQPEGPNNQTTSTMPPQTTVSQGGGPPAIRPEPQDEHTMEPEPEPIS